MNCNFDHKSNIKFLEIIFNKDRFQRILKDINSEQKLDCIITPFIAIS